MANKLIEGCKSLEVAENLKIYYLNMQVKVSEVIDKFLIKLLEVEPSFPVDHLKRVIYDEEIGLESLSYFNEYAQIINIALLNCN